MDRLIFAGEILKLAKELVSMDFDTEAEKKKYEQEHEVRPGTKLTVKKDEKPSAPASAPAKHDFSHGTFYSQRPKLKGAVEKAKGIVSEMEKLEAEAEKKNNDYHEQYDKSSREVDVIRSQHGMSKYNDLPEEAKREVDKTWEPARKAEKEHEEVAGQISQKKVEIEKLMADTEEPEAAKAFDVGPYSGAKEIKEKLDDLHLRYHGTQLREKTKGIPLAKHEEVKEGDHLLSKGTVFRVDKRTPSGQLKLTNLGTGERFTETPKSWSKESGGYLPSSHSSGYQKLDPDTTEHTLALLEEVKTHRGAGKEARITERVAKELFAWGSRRTVSGDPYWMTVRYPGHCHKCHAPIERGEQAFFYPKGRYLFGEKCGHGKEAEDDFLTHSEMDTFSDQGDFE